LFAESSLFGISPKTWFTVGARIPLPYIGGEFNADCLQLGFITDPLLFAESPLLARSKGAFCLLNRPFLFVQTVQANGQNMAGA